VIAQGDQFRAFFKQATHDDPYPYQVRLACAPVESLIHIPAGRGKDRAALGCDLLGI
jgi:hypothetical protein